MKRLAIMGAQALATSSTIVMLITLMALALGGCKEEKRPAKDVATATLQCPTYTAVFTADSMEAAMDAALGANPDMLCDVAVKLVIN